MADEGVPAAVDGGVGVDGGEEVVGPPPMGPPTLARQLTGSADAPEEEGPPVPEDEPIVDVRDPLKRTGSITLKAGEVPFTFHVAAATDIGGSRENQDDYFIWQKGDGATLVLGVFDGHGRELGKLAANVAKHSVLEQLSQERTLRRLRAAPEEVMTEVFQLAHEAVQAAFTKHYEDAGWTVKLSDTGYLLRRKRTMTWSCVHGGTTASVLVILDGRRMILANLGDSTVVVGNAVPAAAAPAEEGKEGDGDRVHVLSYDHSPENPSEFLRVRDARPSERRPGFPELMFVYDAMSFSKYHCQDIFVLKDGVPTVTNKGKYYKNVRNEWASLVATPAHARYQDALAFTRSLGDFHLQTYGVSHVPEVVEFDLTALVTADVGAIMAASDGVWDNWKFEAVVDYVLKDDYLAAACEAGDADTPMQAFMTENIALSKAHFGSKADNMTGVLCYLVRKGAGGAAAGAGGSAAIAAAAAEAAVSEEEGDDDM
eukprot:PLAT5881.1.p1 GENE.PLAT5881.1~~PLAT5881.1.p1  ORF type:complete len:485 (+),score=256.97 PLAT5881.1:33-1487(+)